MNLLFNELHHRPRPPRAEEVGGLKSCSQSRYLARGYISETTNQRSLTPLDSPRSEESLLNERIQPDGIEIGQVVRKFPDKRLTMVKLAARAQTCRGE